ncbi:hypothetical protein ACQCSX_04820 [Pseudarthrobacter sp. P1]|uniref:hypothetical protein n=1 Tax=Pseudarthrobacter sp. P1 TaxID=3418418 RepID=UPI003CEDED8D
MNLIDMLPGQGPAAETVCSRKGCRTAATTQLLWNNPKIHTPERRKIWLACDEHVQWLQDYLNTRDLWRETRPLDAAPARNTPEALG